MRKGVPNVAVPVQLLDVLQRFAATMANTCDVNDVLYELGDSTVSVLAAAGAGVSVADDENRLLFVTATSEAVIVIERAQEEHQAGPCVEAFMTGQLMAVNHIAELDRWPDYQSAARQSGFESVVGLPLAIGEQRLGSLNVYDTRPRTWNRNDLRAAGVLADIATAYILRAGELAEAKQLSQQLQHALDSRVVIEQAKGMLARDHNITVDQAFQHLRSHARRRSTPLRTIAEAIVTLGLHLPPPTTND